MSSRIAGGRYRIMHPIGMGSFAGVFWAEDMESDNKPVAIKMLKPAASEVQSLVDRFCREAEIGSLVDHENAVKFLDFGWYNPPPAGGVAQFPRPFLALELARGLPLDELLHARPGVTPNEVAHILAAVLDALHAAHMRGVVHRDLKPANVIVLADPSHYRRPTPQDGSCAGRLGLPLPGDGHWADLLPLQVKVLDFGLGKLLEVDDRRVAKLTQAGMLAGTAHYMSPEQVRCDDKLDHRADIYGSAMLIHRLICGQPPFASTSIADIARDHLMTPLPPLPDPWCNHRIAAIYHRGGAKDPVDRYQTAAEMAWEFKTIFNDSLMFAEQPVFETPPPLLKPEKVGFGGWLRKTLPSLRRSSKSVHAASRTELRSASPKSTGPTDS